MESQEVPRWENMNKDILAIIFKKLDVVDVIMGASRVCIAWFLASHDKTIWNTIKLNDLDSIITGNPYVHNMQNNGREKDRYHLSEILIEINKFARTVPKNFFFDNYSSVVEEDLTIISKGMPNIQKLALPLWETLSLNSIQSAFSNWKNLQTLIIIPYWLNGNSSSYLELQAIGDNCRNLTTMKFMPMLDEQIASAIISNFPSVERLSFQCSIACTEASMSLINGLPNLKMFNLSHCIFMQPGILVMKPTEELVKTGTRKLDRFMVCCSDCTVCQVVSKHMQHMKHDPVDALKYRYLREEMWKTDEIKELDF